MNNLKTAGDVPTLDSQHSVQKHLETAGDVPTLDSQHSVRKHLENTRSVIRIMA